MRRSDLSQSEPRLSPRLLQLLNLIGQGLSNKEIAHRMDLAESTVKVYAHQLYQRMPATERSRGGIILLATRLRVRDHERVMAIRLSVWIRQYEHTIGPLALEEIKGIMADQVADILR